MKSKFYQKNGLTVYALACGYVQRVTNSTGLECDSEQVDLYLDGCFHVRGGIEWLCFDTVSEARSVWINEVKTVFACELLAFKKQSRLTVGLECVGNSAPRYVLRNNGDYINGYDTKYAAIVLAGALSLLDLVDRHTAIEYLKNKRNN